MLVEAALMLVKAALMLLCTTCVSQVSVIGLITCVVRCEVSWCNIIRGLLEKYPTLFFFAKTWWISVKHACMRRPWILIRRREFFSRLSIASLYGKQNLREILFSALVGFSLLEKYPNFGWEKKSDAESLVIRQKNYESSTRNVLEHCRDGGANCLLTTTPVCCAAQHHVGDRGMLQVRGMCWSIVAMEAPIYCWPQLRSFAPHIITQATQDILSDC